MSRIKYIPPKRENTSPINRLLLLAGVTDNKDLSKNKQRQAKSQLLAFFVSKFWLAPQATQSQDITHLPQITGVNRHKFMATLPAVYEVEDIAKQALKLICRAVTVCTESDSTSPYDYHSVNLTQKQIGVAING